ncbi:MAG: hypothetical protein RLY31_1915 [Bacteroidota bacterium]
MQHGSLARIACASPPGRGRAVTVPSFDILPFAMKQTANIRFAGRAFLLLLTSACLSSVQAQDIHFSQFRDWHSTVNPALAGSSGSDIRLAGIQRRQWKSVPVDYQTVSLCADGLSGLPTLPDGRTLGWGLLVRQDKAGDGALQYVQAGAGLSVSQQIGTAFILRGGLQFLVGQRSVSPHRLTFGSQWNGDVFNAALFSGESLRNQTGLIPAAAAGLHLGYQAPGKRTRVDLGTGLHHVNQPRTNFTDGATIRILRRYASYLTATVETGPRTELSGQLLLAFQGTYHETVAGISGTWHLRPPESTTLAVQAGVGHRWKDAVIPSLVLQVGSWRAGFSYDIHTSRFQPATGGRGAGEVFLEKRIDLVPAPKEFKACPVF